MRVFHKTIRSATIPLLALFLACLSACTTSNRVQYHLDCLDRLQDPPKRPANVQSIRRYAESRAKHEQALVRLGYFETRNFALQKRTLNQKAGEKLDEMVRARFNHLRWSYSFSHESSFIVVTAARDDMPVWGEIIRSFDTKTEL